MTVTPSVRSTAAVLLTCLVAGVSYAGAVTTLALVVFVLPCLVVAFLVGVWTTARRSPIAGIIVSGLVALGLAEAVNVLTQDSAGPAARSTAVAAGCSVLAGIALASSWPGLMLAPVAGIIAGAMALGAGGEVDLVAVVTAMLALLALSAIERQRRSWRERPRRGPAVLLIGLLAAAAAAGAVILQAQHDPRRPEVLAQGAVHLGIRPAFTDPLTQTARTQANESHAQATNQSSSRTRPAQSRRPSNAQHLNQRSSARHHQTRRRPKASTRRNQQRQSRPHARRHPPSSDWWLILLTVVGGLLLLLLLTLGGRFLSVWLAWRRLRRRLRLGDPAQQVSGAWLWAQWWLASCRMAMPAAMSPDRVSAESLADDLPPPVVEPLSELARLVSRATFAQGQAVTPMEILQAWETADVVSSAAYVGLTRWRRMTLVLRIPPPEPRRRPPAPIIAAPQLGSNSR